MNKYLTMEQKVQRARENGRKGGLVTQARRKARTIGLGLTKNQFREVVRRMGDLDTVNAVEAAFARDRLTEEGDALCHEE